MENFLEKHKCEKCGEIIIKHYKHLHDLKCTGSKKNSDSNQILNNNNNFENIKKKEKKLDSPVKYNSNTNKILNNNNNFQNIKKKEKKLDSPEVYLCKLCGLKMKLKDKSDHLLAHELEQNKKNEINNSPKLENFIANNPIELNESSNINNSNDNERLVTFGDDELKYNFETNNTVDNNSNRNNGNNMLTFSDSDSSSDYNNDGLKEDIIHKFPITKLNNIKKLDNEKKKCLICLERFKKDDFIIALYCIHIFHSKCIKEWMRKQNSCPICKSKIYSEDNYSLK